METTVAILMVLGIFVGAPALIGLIIVGFYVKKAKTLPENRQVLKIVFNKGEINRNC